MPGCVECFTDKGWCSECSRRFTPRGLHIHIRVKHPTTVRHLACLGVRDAMAVVQSERKEREDSKR